MPNTRNLQRQMKQPLRVGKTPCVTKGDLLRDELRNGWVTPLRALQAAKLLSLSQRVGEMRRAGMNIIDKWVKTESGSRVKAYHWVR